MNNSQLDAAVVLLKTFELKENKIKCRINGQ
jgi:hypothetical protein